MVVAVVNATLAVSESRGYEGEAEEVSVVGVRRVVDVVLGTEVRSRAIPVAAVQISSTGGAGSDHGTVNRGLSQRLSVVGSS
jgi:hypothetical protein